MTLRLAHLSDIHFGGENAGAVAAALDWLRADPPQLAVVSGDLTVAGRPAEFEQARAWIDSLRQAAPVLILPGNHDTPEFDIARRLFDPWGFWRDAFGAPDGASFEAPGLAVAACNSARGVQPRLNWSKGQLGRAQADSLIARLGRAGPDTLKVATCHHPLVELPGGPMTARVWGGAKAARQLAEARVDLVLTGHIHAPFAMPYPFGDGQTLAVGAGTLSVRERGAPAGFNLIEADELELRVTALGWTGHGLAPWMTWNAPRRKVPERR